MSPPSDDDPDPPPESPAGGASEMVAAVRKQQLRAALFDEPAEVHRFGRYRVVGKLGRGGMGTVMEAIDDALERRVAIKVLHRDVSPRDQGRLLREARALARLSHPNVVQVHEVAERPRPFIAMELVRGRTLAQWQRERPPWKECVGVYLQAGRGLAAVHAQRLIHRDFKPSNCIIDDKGRARVMDFGLVRSVESPLEGAVSAEDEEPDTVSAATDSREVDRSLTQTGAVLGTLAYMSPEQLAGKPVDARSDQFSFCVSLYEALYGERPHRGNSMAALQMAIEEGSVPPPPKGTAVPAAVRRVLLRGLATDREDRWPSMDELLEQLRAQVEPRHRRLVALAVLGGLVVVGGGLGVGAAIERMQLCSGADELLAGAWDDDRRREVEAALLGTELPFVPDTWTRVERDLDAYAAAWAEQHTEACEATRKTGEQSEEQMGLRVACLRARRSSLDSAVRVLADPDEEIARKAIRLVERLPNLDACADLEWLERREQRVPPPEDPDVASEVETLRQRLEDARALYVAAAYSSLREVLEPLIEHAEQLEYPPLRAEVGHLHGQLLQAEGRYDEAERVFADAHALAAEHDHEEIEAEAAAGLAYLVGLRRARPAEGMIWARTALPVAQRLGEPVTLARSIDIVGMLHMTSGAYEESKDHYERALALRQRSLGDQHLDVAASFNNLGNLHQIQGDYDRAEQAHREAVAITKAVLGPTHPRVAQLVTNLGVILDERGQYERSEAEHRRALQMTKDALGDDHPDTATVLNNLGIVLRRQGKGEEAEALYIRALEIRERALGPDHAETADSLMNIGALYFHEGRYEEADRFMRRALEIRARTLGPEHARVAKLTGNVGVIAKRLGRFDEAEQLLRRSVEVNEKALGPGHAEVGNSLNNLATLLLERDQVDEAVTMHRRALQIHEAAVGPEHPLTIESRINLGLALQEKGELDEAKTMHERTASVIEEVLGPEHPLAAYPQLGLARIALASDEPEAARQHAERLVALREREGVPAFLAEARFLLARILWSDAPQRERARSLAEQARQAYAAAGPLHAETLAEVEAWQRRPSPPP